MELNRESRIIIIKEKLSSVFDYLIHIIIFAVLCFILWIPINYYRYLLSWHAILGVIAFSNHKHTKNYNHSNVIISVVAFLSYGRLAFSVLLLMSEAIILFSNNPWYNSIFVKKYQQWIHGILFILATVSFVLSTCIAYHYQSIRKRDRHFYTVHGITGLLATILLVSTCVSGIFTTKSDLFRKYIFDIRPVVLTLLHYALGIVVYVLSIISLCCAYYSNWLQGKISSFERIFSTIVTLFIATWTLKHALRKFINLIKEEISN